jgi:hypothetical protein
MFFLDWGNHNFNSVLSQADAHGPLGRTLVYFNCNVVPLLAPTAKINPTVNLIVGLLNPPSKATCQSQGLITSSGASVASAHTSAYGGSASTATGLGQLSTEVLGLTRPELTRLLSAGGSGGGR